MIDISKEEENKKPIFLVNPQIIDQSKKTSVYEEGCLSLPGQFAEIERPAECTIKYIDYKDPDFLLKFINEQGKILPRRLTGTSLKFQRKISVAVKRARHLALLPYQADMLK